MSSLAGGDVLQKCFREAPAAGAPEPVFAD